MAPVKFLLAFALTVLGSSTTFATGDDDYTRSLCAKINCGLGSVCKIYEGHDRSLKGGSDDGDKGHSGSDDHHNKEEEHEKPEYEKPEYEKPEHEKKEAEPKQPKYYKYAVCEKVVVYTPPAPNTPHAPAPKTPDAPPACPKEYTCGSKAGTYCVMEKESDDDTKNYWQPKCKCAKGCSGEHCEYSHDLCKKCEHDSKCAIKKDSKGHQYAQCYCSSKNKYFDEKSHKCEKHGVKKYSEKEHIEVEHEHPAEKHHKKGKKGKKAKKSLRGS